MGTLYGVPLTGVTCVSLPSEADNQLTLTVLSYMSVSRPNIQAGAVFLLLVEEADEQISMNGMKTHVY